MIHRRGTKFAVSVYDPRLKRRVVVGTYDTEEEARQHENLARSRVAPGNASRKSTAYRLQRLDHSAVQLWARAGRRGEVEP